MFFIIIIMSQQSFQSLNINTFTLESLIQNHHPILDCTSPAYHEDDVGSNAGEKWMKFYDITMPDSVQPQPKQYPCVQPQLISDISLFNIQQPLKPQDNFRVFEKETIKFVKNTNFTKYFLQNLTMHYYSYGVHFFHESPIILKEINNFMKKQKQNYRQHKIWNKGLRAMEKYFGLHPDSSDPKLRSFLMRKMAHKLLRSKLIPEILELKKGKKMCRSYIFSLKIVGHRCRSSQLIKRTQIY